MTSSIVAMIMALLLGAFPTHIYAEPTQDFQTRASFDLAVQKSMVLKLGKSRVETKSAFVTYNERILCGQDERIEGSILHSADRSGSPG